MKALVRKAVQGDMGAKELLYRETVDSVYRYTYSTLSDKHQVDDIVSSVYVKVFKNLSSYRGDSSFRTWIFGILRNELLSYYRAKQVTTGHVSLEENDSIEDEIPTEDIELNEAEAEEKLQIREQEAVAVVSDLMNELPDRYAEILKLRYIGCLELDECAEILGISKNNVKVLLNRAKKKAHKLLVDKKYGSA